MKAPTLTDGTVTLRPHSDDDVPALTAHCSDAEMVRWTRVPVPFTSVEAEHWIATRRQDWAAGTGELTLVVEVDGAYAGQVGLRPDGEGAAEIGYALAPWARGRGVMSAAVRLALAWAFESLDVGVVLWSAHVGNWPSRRVAWACGFAVEGRVRGLVPHRGERRQSWTGSIEVGDPTEPTTRWYDVPELTSERVVLRRHADTDLVRVVEACRDEVTRRWLPELPSPYTLAHALEYVQGREEHHAAGAGVYWAMAEPGSDELLGALGVMGPLGTAATSREVGYWTHPGARGRGVTAAAVRLAARHALLPTEDGGLGLDRVFARAAEGNEASARVLLSAGFTEVGRDRRAERLRDGSVVDFRRFDLLATEVELTTEV